MSTSTSEKSRSDTLLARTVRPGIDRHPGKSGFRLVADGVNALSVRLLLAEHAQSSIDAQYYEIEDDLVGRLFIEALLRAADRGVLVRLLLDDYYTRGHDAGIAALVARPNFELRLYNPFRRRTMRAFDGLIDFHRINRRMHNKSFTVDGAMTVVGGRNIGEHYFGVGRELNFADLDVVGIGPVVDEVSRMFEAYWRSTAAVPAERILPRATNDDASSQRELIARVAQSREEAGGTPYAEAVQGATHSEGLQKDLSGLAWAPARVIYDSPEKTLDRRSAAASRMPGLLIEAFETIENEVLLVSPYFVPRRSGLKRFRELRDRNVDVTVVTNSLASNNQILAHGGYAPVRRTLLEMGVKLYELRGDATVAARRGRAAGATRATLHTKAFVIDRRRLFVGSFNFDPRSANINTEMGVVIDAPALADAFARTSFSDAPRHSFAVTLGHRGRLCWRGSVCDELVVLNREPQTGLRRRLAGRAACWLPIRGQV